jgi:hypothetical protein
MSIRQLPKVGDTIAVSRSQLRADGTRQHPVYEYSGNCASRWKNSDGTIPECRCRGAEYETIEEQMLIAEIMWFADNSIEAHGHLVSDGQKWHKMLEAPHGDVC